jgi:hypothetical protein
MSIQEPLSSHKLDLSDSSTSQEIDKDNSQDKYKSSNNLESLYLTNSDLNIHQAIYTTTLTIEINQMDAKSKIVIDKLNFISSMNLSIYELNRLKQKNHTEKEMML